MTQGLEKLLNLPSMEDAMRDHITPVEPFSEDELEDDINQAAAMLDQAEARLALVDGRDHAESMDHVYKETLKHAQDLMELGFNMDIPRARGIFEVATTMYGRAIEAKSSKRDSELKSMKLALEQRKIDLVEQKLKHDLGQTDANTFEGEATVVKEDRNELIKRLREQMKKP